jgi:hypothetical protein
MDSKVPHNGPTVRALSRINFVVFSQLVGVELPRGVASIFVVPFEIGYKKGITSKRHHMSHRFVYV